MTHYVFFFGGGGLYSLSKFCNKHNVSDVRAPSLLSQRST